MTRVLLLAALALAGCAADAPADAPAATPAQAAAPAATPAALPEPPADAPLVTVYKSPTCGCCSLWADHMQREGFRVERVDTDRQPAIRDSLGVPADVGSCHTAVVEGYVVEGHVPAEHVRRLLAERPDAVGLTVPGMPLGSPGMEQGGIAQPYDVLLVDRAGEASVFASVPGSAPAASDG